MKKNNRQKQVAKRSSRNTSKTSDNDGLGRRRFLRSVRNAAIGALMVGGVGSYAYSAYQKDVAERDLTRIGGGKPSIVQVHDPSCSLCNTLQKNTRKALSNFSDDKYAFLVANITTANGRAFANQHHVPHVTLLLFDGTGNLRQILNGVRSEEELLPVFDKLIEKG